MVPRLKTHEPHAPPWGKRKKQMRFLKREINAALEWFHQTGVTVFNLAALGDSGMLGHDRARCAAEVLRSLGWAGAKNAQGVDVYLRPARFDLDGLPARWPVVFFDDVKPDTAARIARKYSSLVVQTSPNRCHVWIACETPLSEAQRAAVQAALAPKIGADKGSTSGEHFGRAPGFKNQKRGGAWVAIIKKTGGRKLNALTIISEESEAVAEEKRFSSSPKGGRVVQVAGGSESENDFGFAAGRLEWAFAAGRDISNEKKFIAEQIEARALARGKRRTNEAARLYALRTVNAASRRVGVD